MTSGNHTASARAGGSPLAAARERLADLRTRLDLDGTTGESSSGPIFDLGMPGLRFFQEFGPSYAKLTGKPFDFEPDIGARYNAQREIAFAKVRADAERFSRLFSEMTDTDLDFRNSAGSLFDHWKGSTADAARARMTTFLTSADSVWGRIERFAGTLTDAVRQAERIALDKATAVLDVATTTIEDWTAKDVALLVDVATATGPGALADTQIVDAGELLGITVVAQACRTNPGMFQAMRDGAGERLDRAFVPAYEARLTAFGTACAAAQTRLDETWKTVERALGELTTHAGDTFTAPARHTSAASARTASVPSSSPVRSASAAPAPPAPTSPAPSPSVPVSPAPMSPAPMSRSAPVRPVPGPSAGGTISDRLNPAPGAVSGASDVDGQDPAQATGTGGSDEPRQAVQPSSQGQPDAGTATAPIPTGVQSGFLPPMRPASSGGEQEHRRKVPLAGERVVDEPAPAAPGGVIGDDDDPVTYNDPYSVDGDPPRVRQPPAEEPETAPDEKTEATTKEPVRTAWRLNEDGELEAVTLPATESQAGQGKGSSSGAT